MKWNEENVVTLKKNKDAAAKAALEHWGQVAQAAKTAEELSELAALMARIVTNVIVGRNELSEQLGPDFYNELADVKLMLACVEQFEEFDTEAYCEAVKRKTAQLFARIAHEAKN